ncbi:hypothetical protein, partial [Enterobacter cloacae]|uniref:hypothetical protein n=1 Tax=Enterobacter cloacae TaxID=550 RepID=UPI00197AF8F1
AKELNFTRFTEPEGSTFCQHLQAVLMRVGDLTKLVDMLQLFFLQKNSILQDSQSLKDQPFANISKQS